MLVPELPESYATEETGLSPHPERSMDTDLTDCKTADTGHISRCDESNKNLTCRSSGMAGQMEGFMDRCGNDGQWHRYWCILSDDYLYFYLAPAEQEPVETIQLAGYTITQPGDQFQERQFVLSLNHVSSLDVHLGVDSIEDFRDWHTHFRATLERLNQRGIIEAQTNEADTKQTPSAETVKQKLLAEVLRQKLELEKMQAARAGMKGELLVSGKGQSSSPSLGTSAVTGGDKTLQVTRLIQRRMSTQIKLSAVQKQMEASSSSYKEKKTMFQLGKKKPDLVQGHAEIDSKRPDLEEQARILSSALQDLDTCLLSHGASSPKTQTRTRIRSFHHSYDQASLKNIVLAAEADKNANNEQTGDDVSKPKDKVRDVNRSISIKTSVQKFAHKTFAKANLYWNKKSLIQADEKGRTKASLPLCRNSLSDLTPDVIDVTNNIQSNRMFYTIDGSDIPEPPDNFQSDYTYISRTIPRSHQTGYSKNTQEKILSRISLSPSLTNLDTFGQQMRTSASSPSLNKLTINQNEEIIQAVNTADAIAKLTNDVEENKMLLFSRGRQDSTGSVPARKQVSASALAEIQAFEELSMKFLRPDSGTK